MKDEKRKKKPAVQGRSQQTIEAILGASAHILKKLTPNQFNTNKIAEVAGVSIGSVYQFFRNKDAILDEMIHRFLDENHEQVKKIFDEHAGDADLRGLIQTVVGYLFGSFAQEGGFSAFVLENLVRVIGFERFHRMDNQLVPYLIKQLDDHGIKIRPENRELALRVCIQCVRINLLMHFVSPKKRSKEETIQELTELLVRYLEVKEAS